MLAAVTVLELDVVGADGAVARVSVDSPQLVVAGFTGRDEEAVRRHVEELAEHGVAPPDETPTLWRLPARLLAPGGGLAEVCGGATSGEAEPVLVRTHGGELLVAVGSDHTDRGLEAQSIPLAKLVCPKPISAQAWRFAEVADRWDELRLSSRAGGELYQDATLAAIREPGELLERATRVVGPDAPLVLFLGTVAVRTGGLRFDADFTATLEDTATGRTLAVSYAAAPLEAAA